MLETLFEPFQPAVSQTDTLSRQAEGRRQVLVPFENVQKRAELPHSLLRVPFGGSERLDVGRLDQRAGLAAAEDRTFGQA